MDVFRRSKHIERRETGVEQGGKGVKSRQGIKVGKLILIAGNKSFLSDRVMLFRSLRCSLLSALASGKKIISDQHADSWSRAEKRGRESVWCRESKAAVVARFLEKRGTKWTGTKRKKEDLFLFEFPIEPIGVVCRHFSELG